MGARQSMTLGQIIWKRRHALGWTQETLALRVDDGMTQSDISRLERDKIALPRRERLERIARALGIPLGEFLAGSGWAEAERFFDTPHAVQDQHSVVPPGRHRTAGLPAEVRGSAVARLHNAIVQSRTLRERTEELLCQSRESGNDWHSSFQRQRNVSNDRRQT